MYIYYFITGALGQDQLPPSPPFNSQVSSPQDFTHYINQIILSWYIYKLMYTFKAQNYLKQICWKQGIPPLFIIQKGYELHVLNYIHWYNPLASCRSTIISFTEYLNAMPRWINLLGKLGQFLKTIGTDPSSSNGIYLGGWVHWDDFQLCKYNKY